jgi:hypothetical protein
MERKTLQARRSLSKGRFMEWVNLINQLVRTFFVIGIVIVIIYRYGPDIDEIAHTFPERFRHATKLSIGSFSMEIQAQATQLGDPELANTLGTLSGTEVATLIQIRPPPGFLLGGRFQQGKQERFMIPNRDTLKAVAKLQAIGLVETNFSVDHILGSLSGVKLDHPDEFTGQFHDSIISSPLNASIRSMLESYNIQLTEKGIKGVSAIAHAISKQLSDRNR